MKPVYDLIGIGIGPSNLGLAVLLDKINKLSAIFFDAKAQFSWHQGMMLKNSELQVHYLKDLATPVDPTNRYTFISYLVAQNRFFHFLNRKTDVVSRKEFELYYQWVATNLKNLFFSSVVTRIEAKENYFELKINHDKTYFSKNIICGVGQTPYIPNIFTPFVGDKVFHNIDYINNLNKENIAGKDIIVIGGGQSGAEVFYNLLCQQENLMPNKITWVSKRVNFQPVEDGCLSREIFTPFYNRYFNSLSNASREFFLQELHLSGDGIEPNLIDNIYRKIYEMKYLFPTNTQVALYPANIAYSICKENKYSINIKNILSDIITNIKADIIICATGFKFEIPFFLQDLLSLTDLNLISKDYSISKPELGDKKIFIQNGAKQTHGIADPYLSTSAWRNAVIINNILKQEFYNTSNYPPLLSWNNNYYSYSQQGYSNVGLS